MSDSNDTTAPAPIPLHHYNDEDESNDPSEEAQGTINALIAREAREIARWSGQPLSRAAAAYQLAPHEVPFLLGDPDASVRLAAVRVCAAFPLLRVLLVDLKTHRRDCSARVRQEVEDLLAVDAKDVRGRLAIWATEALVASSLFDRESEFETDLLPISMQVPSIIPSGSARERAASAAWARREILDHPAETFEPSPRDEDGTMRKTVTRAHDANRQSWSPPDAPSLVVGFDLDRDRTHPALHGPAVGDWDPADQPDDPLPEPANPVQDDPKPSKEAP